MAPHELARSALAVAAVQLGSGPDKDANIARAGEMVAAAARGGARLVLLPEKWNGFGSAAILEACAESIEHGGAAIDAMRGWARDHAIHLVGGSITERARSGALFNTSLVLDPAGDIVGVYRKVHLFDADVAGHAHRESDLERGGDELVTVAVDGWVVGLSICYDLRFPELYRILALRGAEVLVVPSAFTETTGRAHWEVLLRARAVEDQCYVVAAADCGERPEGWRTYGHSMVVDPWGVVVASAADGDAIVSATLDPELVARVRAQVPALANRRPGAYAWPG